MATNIFQEGVLTLERLGVIDVILPFIIVFAVVFAVMEQLKIFNRDDGQNMKNIHVIIALVMGFAFITPHVVAPGSLFDFVPVMNNFLPQIAVALIAVTVYWVVAGALGQKREDRVKGRVGGWIVIIAVIVTGILYWTSTGRSINLPRIFSNEIWAVVITIAVFLGAIYFIMRDDGGKKAEE